MKSNNIDEDMRDRQDVDACLKSLSRDQTGCKTLSKGEKKISCPSIGVVVVVVVIYFLSLSLPLSLVRTRTRARAPCLSPRLPFFFFLNVKIKEQNSGRRGRDGRSMMIYDVLLTVATRHGASVPLKIEGEEEEEEGASRGKQSACVYYAIALADRRTPAFRTSLSSIISHFS